MDKRKKIYVIIGPEGSGSVFIAQVVSFVVGHCRTFGEWSGYGLNDKVGAENLVFVGRFHLAVQNRFPAVSVKFL